MRKRVITIAVFAAYSLIAQVEAAAQPILYYYFINPNKVVLWHSSEDGAWITASLSENRWTFSPDNEATLNSWRNHLKEGKYKDVEDKEVWGKFLSDLRSQKVDEQVAQFKAPDAEIQVRAFSDDTALVTFLSEDRCQTKRFTKKGGTWQRVGSVDLEKILGIDASSPELKTILNTSSVPKTTSEWNNALNEWLTNALNDSDYVKPISYGGNRWLLQQRISQKYTIQSSDNSPDNNSPDNNSLGNDQPGNGDKVIRWDLLIYAGLFGFLLGALAFVSTPRLIKHLTHPKNSGTPTGLRDKLSRLRFRSPIILATDHKIDEEKLKKAFDDTLSGIHQKVLSQEGNQEYNINSEEKNLRLSAIELAYARYNKALADNTEESLSPFYNLVKDHTVQLLDEFGLDNIGESKRYRLKIAREAEDCFKALRKNAPETSLISSLYPGSKPIQKWLEDLPIAYADYAKGIREENKKKQQEQEELQNKITNLEQEIRSLQSNEKALQDKLESANADAERKYQAQITDLETERDNKQRELQSTKGQLENKKSELERSVADNDSLSNQITGLRGFQNKLEELQQVEKLAGYIFHGQHMFLGGNQPAVAAGLFFLNSYSLYMLSRAIAQNRPSLKEAMLHNLYSISKELKSLIGFKKAKEQILANSPGIVAFAQSFSTSSEGNDARLFQSLVHQVRTQWNVEISPFYFTDQDGNIYRAN